MIGLIVVFLVFGGIIGFIVIGFVFDVVGG